MRIDFIEWDDPSAIRGNVNHIAVHGVTVSEVEDVLTGSGREEVSRSSGRSCKFGWTTSGKFLIVVFNRKETVSGGEPFVIVRPITAYEVEP